MTKDQLNAAVVYNKARADRQPQEDELPFLIACWQAQHGLVVDGCYGPKTLASVTRVLLGFPGEEPKPTMPKCWPLAKLPDGRKPYVTSGMGSKYGGPNTSRPGHYGVDMFYRYLDTDAPMKVGDGGRTKTWWVPQGTPAIAAADGVVSRASMIKTGLRVAVAHADGHETLYIHLKELFVKVGDKVTMGQRLGLVGDNPAGYDARHLHFEVRKIGAERPAVLDPEAWLKGAVYLG